MRGGEKGYFPYNRRIISKSMRKNTKDLRENGQMYRKTAHRKGHTNDSLRTCSTSFIARQTQVKIIVRRAIEMAQWAEKLF